MRPNLPQMHSLYTFSAQFLKSMNLAPDSSGIYRGGGMIRTILDDPRLFYKRLLIPKRNSNEMRTVFEVSEELRAIQYFIKDAILTPLDDFYTSPYSYAYRRGVSAKDNALVHSGSRYMLKLDIRHFFESTKQSMVYSMFKKYTPYNKSILGILTRLVCYDGALCQGACTSPQIVNLVLADFDMSMGALCEDMGIRYSRYCDDLTFSSNTPFHAAFMIRLVETALTPLHYKLNARKTRFLGPGQRLEVTGAVVNNTVRAARPYRQKIRQELYYIKKYGLNGHLERIRPSWYRSKISSAAARHYLFSLRGRIGYVAMLDPGDPFVPWALSELEAITHAEIPSQ